MATVFEKPESRFLNNDPENPSVELVYGAVAALNEIDAVASVEAATSYTYLGLVRQGCQASSPSPGIFEVRVRYGPRKRREPGVSRYSFDTNAQTVHMSQSLSTIARHAIEGRDPTDFKGAIGVGADGRVEGVEVLVPSFQYTEEHTLPMELVTPEYVGTLYRLTGRINDDDFKHFRKYECLFLGASGERTSEELWRITYTFLGSKTVEDFKVGDITVPLKHGWDVLWVYYEDVVEGDPQVLLKKPVEVHIEQVYLDADFGELQIGT